MFKDDAQEAAPIMQRAMRALLGAVPARPDPDRELPRANLRAACGNLILNAEVLIQDDVAGPPLADCFELSRLAGVSFIGLEYVRKGVEAEAPALVGALMIKNAIIHMTLATEARIIVDMTFVSREDVDELQAQINAIFGDAEEVAADDMDQMTYRALVELHAAVMFFLADTARPLPRMLAYRFGKVMPSLVLGQRLYYDASRADELRDENKVPHPAFMPLTGRALSA